ncbi:MAG: DUF2493 domain-containing protein [Patescibacteria group bacterium]|nr:DUF2493 domain-containing protein [Patescibacteria group bacterium]
MTVVLVCGGRFYGNEEFVFATLDALDAEIRITRLINGGATGADALAREWWKSKQWGEPETYRAKWTKYGKPAGPIRNQQMLDEGKPDLVVAFPGGSGTADMIARAKAAGVRVIEP